MPSPPACPRQGPAPRDRRTIPPLRTARAPGGAIPAWPWRAGGPAWWLAACALALLLSLPLLLVDVPPVLDYPNHLARIFVLAHPSDPVLAAMYAPRWRILPNLATDLAGVALMQALPVHVAGRILLGLTLLLPVLGVLAYARAALGRSTWWSLASALAAGNGAFLLGFLNYVWGTAAALLVAALWIAGRRRRPVATTAACALAGVVVFFCHVLGVAFLAVLLAAHEAAHLATPLPRTRHALRGRLRPALASLAGLTVALAPAAALYAASPFGSASPPPAWSPLGLKAQQLLMPFSSYSVAVTKLTAGMVVVLLLLALARRRLVADRGSVLAGAALLALWLVAPFAIKGGTFVDARLPLLPALLLFAGLDPDPEPRDVGLTAAAIVLALGVRGAVLAQAWSGHAVILAELRRAIAPVRPGERVLAVLEHPQQPPDRPGSVVPGLLRTDLHLPALLVIERRAFWPLLFADPTQQPIAVRAPYASLAQPLGEPPDARRLDLPPGTPGSLADWSRSFDAVLVLGPDPPRLLRAPPTVTPPSGATP